MCTLRGEKRGGGRVLRLPLVAVHGVDEQSEQRHEIDQHQDADDAQDANTRETPRG
jgi:hypothetical protein